MHLDPIKGPGIPPSEPVRRERSDQAVGSTPGSVGATSFLPTAALTGLLTRLQGMPDVRDDVVRQARERLTKGDLLTPASAAAVASALIGVETHG